jgi:hypothetical protein
MIAPRLRQYRPFAKAREYARSLKLKSREEWSAFIKSGRQPADIPAVPWITYRKQGWVSNGDWLGTGTIATQSREYRPFAVARTFARNMGLKNQKEWFEFSRTSLLPHDIPAKPDNTYRDQGWAGIGDWLGSGTIATRSRKYRPFAKAREFSCSLRLKNRNEWSAFIKSGRLPPDIPAAPWQTYRDHGWVGLGDWLGTGAIASHLRRYRSFEKAHTFARSLKLKNVKEWRAFSKSGRLPSDIPVAPEQVYRDQGWAGYGHWLGNKIA